MATSRTLSEIERLSPWFHNLHLPGGLQTAPDHPLGDFPRNKWIRIASHLPEDLRGVKVLDVGCNAGFYSFELARRGAKVVALDHDAHYLGQAEWARGVLGLEDRVELRHEDAYSLAGSRESFDIVLFLGIFYHLRYPLLVLDSLALVTRSLLVFQSMTAPAEKTEEAEMSEKDTVFSEEPPVPLDLPLSGREAMNHSKWPKLAFIERRLADDPTNWWAPNSAAAEALLRSSGFRIVARPGPEIYVCEPDRGNPSSFWTWDEREYWRAVTRTEGSP